MVTRAKRAVFAVCLAAVLARVGLTAGTPKPKLVVAIIIDQFRYDYLTRFRASYHGGLDQLMDKGAVFTNAFYAQVPTVTAVGHSIFMSGAMPAVSGIVGNSWFDRDENQVVTSVCDWNEKIVGGPQDEKGPRCTDGDPASPRRLLVSTVGDELRTADPKSEVIGISLKPRAAILPSGHRAAGAFWFDDATGNFVTSTFYMSQLPPWVEGFNRRNLPASYVDRTWEGFPTWKFRAPAGSKRPYSNIAASPWGNELVEALAEQALREEKLGQRGVPDLLTVSFSSNDYVGHRVGPDAPEVRDMAIRTDQLLAKLFHVIDQQVGMQNVVIVLSADHGVSSSVAANVANKMSGAYVPLDIEQIAQSALDQKFGHASWVVPNAAEAAIYLDRSAVANARTADGVPVPEAQIFKTVKDALFRAPQLHVARVYTRDQLETGVTGDFIAQAEMNGFNPRRSGDFQIVLEPNDIFGTSGTNHFSPYSYDRHVPVLFMGPGIKPGRYNETVMPNDIAPTLATMLDVQTPSGSSGRVLAEMLLR